MHSQVDQHSMIAAASAAVLVVSILLSRRRSPLWLLDPRGLYSVVLFFNTSGLLLYRMFFGEYPYVFGLDTSHIDEAAWLHVSLQLGFLAGSFVPLRSLERRMPGFEFREEDKHSTVFVFLVAIIGAALVNYAALASGWGRIFDERYGAAQFESRSVYYNVGTICMPTLASFIILWGGVFRRKLKSWKLGLVTLFAIAPSLIRGGRKDLIFVALSVFVSLSLLKGRVRLRNLAALGAVLVTFSLVIATSRSGDSLDPYERMERVEEKVGEESASVALLKHALVMDVSMATVTAAMSIFPRFEPFTSGATYVEALANLFTPRFLFGDVAFKPAGVRFKELFYDRVTNFGMDYSIAAEGYQNFGVYGPFLAAFVLSMVTSLTFLCASRLNTSLWLLIHWQLMLSSMWVLRTDAHSFFKLAGYGVLWLFVLYYSGRLVGRLRIVAVGEGGAASRRIGA